MLRAAQFLQLFATALVVGSGCASFAKKPPTPAAQIPARESMSMTAAPGERYFVLIFGSQSSPKKAKYTHTWSTVVKVTGCGPGAPAVEEQTISWMPASLDIHPMSFRVEPGANLTLPFTIEEMLRQAVEDAQPLEQVMDTFLKLGQQCRAKANSPAAGPAVPNIVGAGAPTGASS